MRDTLEELILILKIIIKYINNIIIQLIYN